MKDKVLGIIFHSGSYDRVYHGLSLAVTSLALNIQVKLFFTYWALEYLKKDNLTELRLDAEAKKEKQIIEKNIEKGHLQKISEVILQVKKLGAEIYACTGSMGLLNITRDEFVREVDKSMGLTTFLTECVDSQILFI